MLTITSIVAIEVVVNCPHCGQRDTGFCGDPRGGTFTCNWCDAKYSIHPESDIEME